MKQSLKWLFIFFIIAAAGDGWGGIPEDGSIRLFSPIYDGKISVERAIKERTTTRAFRPQPLTMVQLSQLFWSAQGITDEASGFRAAPSGGADPGETPPRACTSKNGAAVIR